MITLASESGPVLIPTSHRGPVFLPTGRMVWWTGRVAIGLRHDGVARQACPSAWLQDLLRVFPRRSA